METLKQVRTTNTKARKYANNLQSFKASNLEGIWIGTKYVILSYAWYPLFIFINGIWYENKDRYSVSTSKQLGQVRPLHEDTLLRSWDEMKTLLNS